MGRLSLSMGVNSRLGQQSATERERKKHKPVPGPLVLAPYHSPQDEQNQLRWVAWVPAPGFPEWVLLPGTPCLPADCLFPIRAGRGCLSSTGTREREKEAQEDAALLGNQCWLLLLLLLLICFYLYLYQQDEIFLQVNVQCNR